MSSADNLCKQFGPKLGPTQHWARSGPKLFDTLMVFQNSERIYSKKKYFEKHQQTTKNYPVGKEVKGQLSLDKLKKTSEKL